MQCRSVPWSVFSLVGLLAPLRDGGFSGRACRLVSGSYWRVVVSSEVELASSKHVLHPRACSSSRCHARMWWEELSSVRGEGSYLSLVFGRFAGRGWRRLGLDGGRTTGTSGSVSYQLSPLPAAHGLRSGSQQLSGARPPCRHSPHLWRHLIGQNSAHSRC